MTNTTIELVLASIYVVHNIIKRKRKAIKNTGHGKHYTSISIIKYQSSQSKSIVIMMQQAISILVKLFT